MSENAKSTMEFMLTPYEWKLHCMAERYEAQGHEYIAQILRRMLLEALSESDSCKLLPED